MPYDVIANEVKEIKASAELLGEGRLIGNVREVLQPTVDKNGLAVVRSRARARSDQVRLVYMLPLKRTLVDTCERLPRRAQGRQAGHLGRARVTLPPGEATRR